MKITRIDYRQIFTHNGLSGCLSRNWSLVFNSNRARTGRNDLDDSSNISKVLPGGGTLLVIWNLNKSIEKKQHTIIFSRTNSEEKFQNRLELYRVNDQRQKTHTNTINPTHDSTIEKK
jgi:hypothetical protein